MDIDLDIDIDEIELFQKNLWFWDPYKSKIWLIWNEEAFWKWEDYIKKIKNNKLDSEKFDILKRSENDWFFTKKFSKTYLNISWKWYEIMKDYYCEDLDKIFISEFYFLPADKWSDLFNIYWWTKPKKEENNEWKEYYSRKSYYILNNFEKLLKNRIKEIKYILDGVDNTIVHFYGINSYKILLLEKILKKKFKKTTSWKEKIYSLNYGTNKINIIPFITYNFNYYNDSKKYDDFIKNWWKDNDNLCECWWIVLDKMNEDDTTIFECIKCWNKY